jgi:hypothetical protein
MEFKGLPRGAHRALWAVLLLVAQLPGSLLLGGPDAAEDRCGSSRVALPLAAAAAAAAARDGERFLRLSRKHPRSPAGDCVPVLRGVRGGGEPPRIDCPGCSQGVRCVCAVRAAAAFVVSSAPRCARMRFPMPRQSY